MTNSLRTQHTTAALFVAFLMLCACSPTARIRRMSPEERAAAISLADKHSEAKGNEQEPAGGDSLVIRNIDGQDLIVLRTIRDENGEYVANEVLAAAKVTARFRNVAERHGRIRLEFQISVPAALQNSRWQLRYSPMMFIKDDSLALDKVYITGNEYRKRQLRGYQHYQRFIDSIISDSTAFIRTDELEIFIRRNIPQLWAFRNDSSYVTDDSFRSAFGVSGLEALEHYTDKMAKRRNARKLAMKDAKFRKYVKAPLVYEGIRLDTVMTDGTDYIYNYVQTIHSQPGLKKVEIALDGDIFEQDRLVCGLTRSQALTFYVSSLSSFADDSPHYLTRVLERRATESDSFDITYRSGSSALDPDVGDNAAIINEIKSRIRSLATNETFELDSVIISAGASPEGKAAMNAALSQKRGDAAGRYFSRFANHISDSLRRENVAMAFDEAGTLSKTAEKKKNGIRISGRQLGEDWDKLDRLIAECEDMTGTDKEEYFRLKDIQDPDFREAAMSGYKWYGMMRSKLYPKLRGVNFTFNLHRRAMVKDTVHTTVLDSTYMSGVRAIKDRDYRKAVEILRPYDDYNTAVAYCAGDFNHSALAILERLKPTARVNYMMAIIYARLGDERSAVECFMRSCTQEARFIHRGNLDPEIYALIRKYDLKLQQ